MDSTLFYATDLLLESLLVCSSSDALYAYLKSGDTKSLFFAPLFSKSVELSISLAGKSSLNVDRLKVLEMFT